jgi:hypothetical protein
MNPGTFCLTAAATYYAASLIQTVFHRFFGHAPRIAGVHAVHINGHHSQYAKAMLSERWIPTEQHVAWYYAIPFSPLVLVMFRLLPPDLFVVHLGSLFFAIWWHVYLHRQYHVRGVWWERFSWFQRKRRLHFLHHQRPDRNFAIVEYGWDRLLGTYQEKTRPPAGNSAASGNERARSHA